MGLKIKKFQEIFNSFATWVTASNPNLSDFNVGSGLRTLTESISLQVEEFYFNMKQNIEYAIETAIYSAFGFEAIKADYATGYVTINFVSPLQNPIILPADLTFSTTLSNSKIVYYKTISDTTVPIRATEVIVEVKCTEIGTIGNCELGEINNLITGNALISSVTNNTRITNGVDAETVADMKERFHEYLKSLGRATDESIAYGLKTVEGVAGVYIDDNYIGFVNAYVHDKNGNLPEDLKYQCLTTVDEYRAGGIEVKVLPVVRKEIDLNITLVVADNTDMNSTIESVDLLVTNYLNSYTVSENFYVSDVITLIMKNYKDLIITLDIDGNKNIDTLNNELIVAGDIIVNYKYLSDWR